MPFTPPSLDLLEPVTTNRVTGFTPPPLSSMEGVKKTREQVMAEVGAAQGRMDVVNPPETLNAFEKFAGADLTGQLVGSVNRLRPDLLLRDTMVGVSDPQRFIGGNGGIQAPSPIDTPVLSPEVAKKAIEFFSPVKAVEGGVGQGVQNFLAEMASGLTSLPSAAAMAGGLPKTTFPNFARTVAPLVFAPGMIQDSGHAVQQATEAQGPAEQTQAWLSALSSVLFPLMMAKHGGTPEAKPSGVRFGDITDGRNPIYDNPGGGDLVGPARQLPFISESTFRQNVNPKPKDIDVTVDPTTLKLSRERTPINLPAEMGKPIPGQKQLPLVSESSLEALRNPVPVDRTFEGRTITAPDYLTPGEQRGAEYLGEGKLDLSTLSPEQQQKINEIVRQQKVRPASGPVPILGEPAPVEGASLGAGLVQPPPSVVFQNETAPVKPVYQPSAARVEPQGGMLPTSGQEFSGQTPTPGFLKTAEQKIAARSDVVPTKPSLVAEPEGSPIPSVTDKINNFLRRRDILAAVEEASGKPSIVKAKQLDKLREVGREKVSLTAAERIIFDETWDKVMGEMNAPKVDAPKGMQIKAAVEKNKEAGSIRIPDAQEVTQLFERIAAKVKSYYSPPRLMGGVTELSGLSGKVATDALPHIRTVVDKATASARIEELRKAGYFVYSHNDASLKSTGDKQGVALIIAPNELSAASALMSGEQKPTGTHEPYISAGSGLQIKAAMERGQKRRGETGSVFPRGDEGRVSEKPTVLKSSTGHKALISKSAAVGTFDPEVQETAKTWRVTYFDSADKPIKHVYFNNHDQARNSVSAPRGPYSSLPDMGTWVEEGKPKANKQGYADIPYTRMFGLSDRGGNALGDAVHQEAYRAIPELKRLLGDETKAKRFYDLWQKKDAVSAEKEFSDWSGKGPETRDVSGIKWTDISKTKPEQAPKEDLAAKVRPMTGAQFREWSKSAEGGITAEAHRYGMGAKTQAQVDALKEGEVAAKGEMRAAMESGDMDGAMNIAVKGQFFREAHEAATGVGSAGEKLRKDDAGYKAPFPQSGGGMPPVEPKSGGIGGGINKAIEKNKEGGSVPNPFPFIVEKFKKKEQEKRGDTFALSGPRIALDPKESGFNDVTRKVDAQQLWNRVKNKLTPAEKDIYEKSGVDKKIVEMGKVSPEEAAQMLQEGGVEVRTHSYGMEGKVSEAKKEYDRMTHEWYDTLDANKKSVIRTYLDYDDPKYLKAAGIDRATVDKWQKLKLQVADEPADTSPRATSHYESVSAFSTKEPMPEWTKTRSGKNVQRVDVVVPVKKLSEGGKYGNAAMWVADNLHENMPNTLGWAMIQYKTGPKSEKIAVIVEAQSRWGQEVRSRFGNAYPEGHPDIERLKHPLLKDYNRLILKAAIDQARKEGATHIVVSDSKSALMSEVLDTQYKGSFKTVEKATEFLENDTRLKADGYKVYEHGGDFYLSRHQGGFDFNYDTSMPKIMEELSGGKGERVSLGEHKNALVPDKGVQGLNEPVHHKNTYDTYDAAFDAMKGIQGEKARYAGGNMHGKLPFGLQVTSGHADGKYKVSMFPDSYKQYKDIANEAGFNRASDYRSNLIFRNPDGTPKTDVSGTMYKIPQTEKKFSLFEKDRPESVAGRLYVNPIGPIVKQTAKDVATLGKKVKEVGTDFIRAYAEPLQEQMGRLGGPVGKKVSEEAGQIISRGKELYGELTPVIDPAKKQVGKMMREGTTWMRGRNEVTPTASFNNFFGVNEGAVVTPLNAKRGMKLAADANLAIGKMAERANPGFKASGKLQRIPTTVGYDFIVNGGEGRQRWIEGAAKLNNKPIADVQNFFDKMKQTLGDPSSDAASLDRINQDFTRKFPRTITHIKTATGWHEVVVSDPFNYLEQAAQRTAHSVAFREVYPLIQHQGQWVQSGKLQATRKAILKELDKGSDIVKFDNLVKALQGHPLDTFKGGATSAIGSISGVIGSPLKALMLSANAPVNIGEVISGGPSIFMGYTTVGTAMKKLVTDNTFYDQLELTGARNKAMYNLALDPSSPTRSLARQVATGVRTLTGQQFLNEIQETTAAASAKVYSDAIKGGKMGEYSLNRAKALFRAMGFNNEQAGLMVKGDAALLKQFENRAAAWLTTGNQATGEMSRLGASRLFNAAFWFHKYPQMTMNQFRSVAGNWVDDGKAYWKKPSSESWSPLYHNSVLMGRLIGGRTFQGAITLGILAGISGGVYGLYQTTREAEEDVLKFAGDSLVSGFGGPISVLKKLNQNVKGGESFTKELVGLSAPATLNQELIDMGMGVGRYSGMGKAESIATFLESKTPITRSIKMGMAVAGLVEKDLELEVAMKAFYKWRREQPGYAPMGQMGGTEEQVDLRSGMQKVKKAIEDGGDWVKELEAVKNTKSAGNSLRAGTMLQLNGKALDEEQMKSLKSRLGANGLEKIKLRDAMVREVGRELNEKTESGEKQAPQSIKKPTGKWAVDYETDSVRSERVMGKLEPRVREFLKKNEVEDVGYTPSLKRGNQKQELTMGQVMVLEDEYVARVNQLVGELVKNKNLEGQTQKLRHTLISNMLKGAREIARAKSQGNIPEDPEQRGR